MSDTDMRVLQTLFDRPPPAPHVFDAGRARLQQSYRRSLFRLPRFSLPTMAGLGAAAMGAAAVAVAAVVTVSATPAISHGPAAESPTRQLTTGQVLLSAARTVASLSSSTPRPQQWLRIITVQTGGLASTSTEVNWMTFNGVLSAYDQAGKLVVHTDPGAATSNSTPMGAYDMLVKLPSNTQDLLKFLSSSSAGQAFSSSANPEVRAWDNIVQLLWNSPVAVPPKLQAEIFVALTKLSGLRVEKVTDVTGRAALGLYLPAAGHSDLLLDPNTYQVIGRVSISSGHYTKAEQMTFKAKGLTLPPAGAITWSIIRSTTLVHGPGQN
jgi:hypothetical protein